MNTTETPTEQPSDTQILDWMEKTPFAVSYPDETSSKYSVFTGDFEATDGTGPTLRAALADAMRKAQQPGGRP